MTGLLRRAAEVVVTPYSYSEAAGISTIVVIGVTSITAVVFVALFFIATRKRRSTHWQRTHLVSYIACLMIANVLQAIGAVMNSRWISLGGVVDGEFCRAQGGIKNVGNNGTALWSFMVALHLFNLLFLRWQSTPAALLATLIFGWSAVALVASSGPILIESPSNGSYFGPSGLWCWITDKYPAEQEFMEYFFEFISAGFGFALYALILLRVRGNLVIEKGRWHFQWVSRSQAWQLSMGRDMLDTAMLRVAKNMVWYPVVYSLLIVPIALARISTFLGHHVPFWATVVTDVLFNSTGLINAILFMLTRNALPDTSNLPDFTMPRKIAPHSLTSSRKEGTIVGVTPFELPPVDAVEAQIIEAKLSRQNSDASRGGHVSHTFFSLFSSSGRAAYRGDRKGSAASGFGSSSLPHDLDSRMKEVEAGLEYDLHRFDLADVPNNVCEADRDDVAFSEVNWNNSLEHGHSASHVRPPQQAHAVDGMRHHRAISESNSDAMSIATMSSVHSNTPLID